MSGHHEDLSATATTPDGGAGEHEARRADRTTRAVASASLFLSGALALVYEICWIRKSTLVFGSTTYAVSTVLAVFFGGLALGSYLFGRQSRRVRRPLKVYAWLEIGVGLLALASPLLFIVLDGVYGSFYPVVSRSGLLSNCTRAVLVSAAVLPASVLMGGTLPLFCRQFVSSEGRISGSVGFLYGLNTLGAACGCAVCGFMLIRYVGVDVSIYASGLFSVLIGIAVLSLRLPVVPNAAKDIPALSSEAPPPPEPPPRRTAFVVVHILFFLTGFVALGYEVLWTRFLALLTSGTILTYTTTLTVVLVGIVIGTFLTARLFDRLRRRALVFGAVQVASGLAVLMALLVPATWWRIWLNFDSRTAELGIVGSVLLLPAILSGVSFPLAIRMVVDQVAAVGVGVGRMAAMNTFGGIAGSLVVGFAALPSLGLQTTLLAFTGMSLLVGFVAWVVLEQQVPRTVRGLLIVASVATWWVIPWATGTRLPADLLAHGRDLVEFREGLSCQIAVVRTQSGLRLEADQMWQGGDKTFHQVMAAHIPALLHSKPNNVLVVGLGTGQTAGRFLAHGVERLDCVEIEPKLIDVVREHFPSAWMDDARVAFIVEDGRNYLSHTEARYDLISIEAGQLFRRGVASFYTAEFYRVAQQRLHPNGLICQFVPLALLDAEGFRTVIATFCAEFPQSVLWYNTSELLLIGGTGEPVRLSELRFQTIANSALLQRDLDFSYWNGPEHALNRPAVYLAGFLAGPNELASLSQDAAIYRDDRPFLEYTTVRRMIGPRGSEGLNSQLTNLIATTDLIRTHLAPLETVTAWQPDRQTVAAAETVRLKNLDEIVATAHTDLAHRLKVEGDFGAALQQLREAIRVMPQHAEANASLGRFFHETGRLEQAMAHYQRSLETQPRQPLLLMRLGRLLEGKGRPDAANQCYERAHAIDPELVERILRLR